MLTMPAACWLCRMPLTLADHGICSYCQRALKPPCCCPRCGLSTFYPHEECGRCQRHPPSWQRLVFVADWQPPLKELVKKLKFSQQTALSVMLARLILLTWLTARREGRLQRPDLLLYVPLHRSRAWRRGYNQLDDMARYLAHWLAIPCAPGGLSRKKRTRIQHFLSARARRRNLRGAFKVEIEVKGRHIALLDDVVTTGSTVEEIARLLLRAGAASVQVLCLCRTL